MAKTIIGKIIYAQLQIVRIVPQKIFRTFKFQLSIMLNKWDHPANRLNSNFNSKNPVIKFHIEL